MADDRLQQAIDIVARHVIASTIDGEIGVLRESYAEIGDHDWDAVVERAVVLAPYPDREQYAAAYDFLAGRAEGGM